MTESVMEYSFQHSPLGHTVIPYPSPITHEAKATLATERLALSHPVPNWYIRSKEFEHKTGTIPVKSIKHNSLKLPQEQWKYRQSRPVQLIATNNAKEKNPLLIFPGVWANILLYCGNVVSRYRTKSNHKQGFLSICVHMITVQNM